MYVWTRLSEGSVMLDLNTDVAFHPYSALILSVFLHSSDRQNGVIPSTTAEHHGGSVDNRSSLTRARHGQRRRVREKELRRNKILCPHFAMHLMASQPLLFTALPPVLSLSQEVHGNGLRTRRSPCLFFLSWRQELFSTVFIGRSG